MRPSLLVSFLLLSILISEVQGISLRKGFLPVGHHKIHKAKVNRTSSAVVGEAVDDCKDRHCLGTLKKRISRRPSSTPLILLVSSESSIMAEQTEKAFLKQPKVFLWYEKRHSNIPAHISPCFRVKEGDHVTIGQCRPLSKTVRFNVLKVIPAGSSGGGGKKAFAAIASDLHSKLPQKQRTRFGHSKLPQADLCTALSSSDPSTFLLMLTIVPFLVCLTATLFLCKIPPSSTTGEDKEEAQYFRIINADLKTQSRQRFWKSIVTVHYRVRISDNSSFLSRRWFGAHIWTLMDMAVIFGHHDQTVPRGQIYGAQREASFCRL
ncbi:40S ribosomal protein S11 [Camellia lanceoleosa]|uniref:40S ribosomal protein S11 n=1 Tax=Camellia lanceoleosa TaxID=1840588 RepID=A0ACC0IHV9_9ERIC|nr:40S ribosomal protein S11 [Camellia lanceoleosa]